MIDASLEAPVLVDFWAPWCGPCRTLSPTIEKVVNEKAGKIRLVKINIDENPGIAGQLGVQSIPAVFAFAGGRPVDAFIGAYPESEVRKFADKVIAAAGPVSRAAGSIEDEIKNAHGGCQAGVCRRRPQQRGADFRHGAAASARQRRGADRHGPRLSQGRRGRAGAGRRRHHSRGRTQRRRLHLADGRAEAPDRGRRAGRHRRARPASSTRTPTTTRRGSISPSRSTPKASATRRPNSWWR